MEDGVWRMEGEEGEDGGLRIADGGGGLAVGVFC